MIFLKIVLLIGLPWVGCDSLLYRLKPEFRLKVALRTQSHEHKVLTLGS